MTVAIYERNLMWSVRLANACRKLGWEPIVIETAVPPTSHVDVAILNLSWPVAELESLLGQFKAQSTAVIGHAGHKETELLKIGQRLELDRVVSNSELANRLELICREAVEGFAVETSNPPIRSE